MDAGSAISLEEFRRLAAEQTAEEKRLYRAEKLHGDDSTQLLWTALLPDWTVPLAKASRFPVEDVAGYFEDLRAKQIVERSQIVGENETSEITVYSMDDVAREDVIDAYVQNPESINRLRSTLGLIGSNILEATGLNKDLDSTSERIFEKRSNATPAIARFALLAARATSRPEIVDEFEKRVEAAFRRRESATIRDWINTAFPFSSLFLRFGDDSMKQALQRASQRLILLRREETDRRHLKHFYERTGQFNAFKDLMTGSDSSWALHFLGAGGVGKTMLVRKITVDWAKKFDAVAARVDFDYLKAEYPTLDPGMLLWAFAQELRAYAGPDSRRLFNKAERKFEELRSQIQSEVRSGLRQRATDHPDFAEAISDYCDALKLIPRRVLLIVDTCEELAKIGMGLTPVQNIHETFRILRALHDGAQTLRDESAPAAGGLASLRVIFSGRRPLASAGENWRCPSASQLDARPFLKLHPVRGFTKQEAESFLREKLSVDQKLISAIIRRSPDTGNVAKIEWTDGEHESSPKQRCNPYDLKLYADWTREDPPPTAAEILATPPATQYVELRVIRRLHADSLKEALPAVALLGHFDRRVLQHTFGDKKTPEEIEQLFDLLQQEEWINQRGVPDEEEGSNLILDVEPGIRTRLFVYYKDSPALREFQTRAADYLEQRTLVEDPSRLDWSFYDAALTVLEADPDRERVVRWWKRVDANMFAACLPEWIRNATDRMQNEGGAAAWCDPEAPSDVPPESRLRPAVLATYASGLLRSTARADLGVTWRELKDVWAEVLKKYNTLAKEMPELELRARAGLISASLRSNELPPAEEVDRFWAFGVEKTWAPDYGPVPANDPQMLASVIAAVEAMVEYSLPRWKTRDSLITSPNSPIDERVSALSTLLYWPRGLPNDADFFHIRGFGVCLVGRIQAIILDQSVAMDSFRQAFYLCGFEGYVSTNARPWHDWIPPEDIASRVRLEFIRALYGRHVSVEELVEALLQAGTKDGFLVDSKLPAIAPIRLDNIDNDRLHSAFLRLLACLHPIDEDEIAKYEQALEDANRSSSRSDPALESEWACVAHQVTPPLFVTLAELKAEKGQADEVLSDLSTLNSRVGYQTQLHIARACAKIISRFRMRDVGEVGGQTLAASGDIEDRMLAWELTAQDGARAQQSIPALPDELNAVKAGYQSEPYTDLQIEKLRWSHAIWQTRYIDRNSYQETVLEWATNNLNLFIGFPTTPYEAASVELDFLEMMEVSSRYGIKPENSPPRDRYSHSDLRDQFGPQEYLALAIRVGALENEQILRTIRDIKHPVVVLLGIRKVAEIVAHDADLLALRLPERAVVLYQWAQEWFRLVEDFHSEFIAATSEAMCIAPNKAKALNQRMTVAFNKLNVPVAKDLPALIDRKLEKGEEWAPRCWRPRLTRYLLSLVAERESDRPRTGRRVVDELLPGAVTRSLDEKVANVQWSADLGTWFTNADQPPGLFSRIWKITKQVSWVLLGIAIWITIIALVFRAFGWAVSFVVPSFSSHHWAVRFLSLVLFVTTISLSIRLALKVRQRKKATTPLDQSVTQAAPTGDPIEDEYPTWRIWVDFATIWVLLALLIGPYFNELVQRWGWRLLAWTVAGVGVASLIYVFRGRFSRLSDYLSGKYDLLYSFIYTKIFKLRLEIFPPPAIFSAEWSLTDLPRTDIQLRRVPKSRLASFFIVAQTKFFPPQTERQRSALAPYSQLGGGINIKDVYWRLWSILGDFPMMVEINLPEGPINGLCWEAIVYSSTPLGPDHTSFICYRCPTAMRRSARSPQTKLVGLLFAETEPARSLRPAWTDFEITNRDGLVKGRPDVSIVHLVGSAESSYQSVGYHLGRETERLNIAKSEMLSGDDALIRAEDLLRAFPNVQICIIQETPRAIHSERLDGDRKDAFYARLFASQLSALGVGCVLTIPPLDGKFALDLVSYFAGVLTQPSVKRSELLEAVGKGRREIETYVSDHHASPETLQEVPKDLCLYLDTEWHGHLIT